MEDAQNNAVVFLEAMAVFPDPQSVEEGYRAMQAKNPTMTKELIWEMACRSAKLIATGQGIVASLPGVIPGLGTAAQIAASAVSISGESYVLLRKMAYLQFLAAVINGHDVYHEDRKGEFITVLGVMTGAVLPAKEAAKRLGGKFAQRSGSSKDFWKNFTRD